MASDSVLVSRRSHTYEFGGEKFTIPGRNTRIVENYNIYLSAVKLLNELCRERLEIYTMKEKGLIFYLQKSSNGSIKTPVIVMDTADLAPSIGFRDELDAEMKSKLLRILGEEN